MKRIKGISFFIVIIIGLFWFSNLYKLIQCDFKRPWKGEIVHGIGLIPFASVITVWNDDK